MGYARSFHAVAALLVLGCAPARSPVPTATLDRCLVVDTATATPDTIHAIVELSAQSTLDCEHRSISRSDGPVVIAVSPPRGVDVRDVLEGRAAATKRPDVVVTHDPQLIDLARRSGGYLVEPLPWSVTYVLVSRTTDTLGMPGVSDRDALARDVVAGDSRGAIEPFSWLTAASCARPLEFARTSAAPVVAYSSGDAIARAIAERIASLSASRAPSAWLPMAVVRPGAPLRVTPIARDSIANALAAGRAAAAVFPIARDPSTPCGTRANEPVLRAAMPLVDARPHAIVRRGSGAAFIIGVDGTLHFVKRGTR
jgi:hypothetical protein